MMMTTDTGLTTYLTNVLANMAGKLNSWALGISTTGANKA
jgi:hypothetical protein